MPSGTPVPVVVHAYGLASCQRPPHEEVIHRYRTQGSTESKEERHGIGTERMVTGDRLGRTQPSLTRPRLAAGSQGPLRFLLFVVCHSSSYPPGTGLGEL